MRKLMIGLLIFSALVSDSFGATSFNGSSAYITMADNAVLDIPDAPWTFMCWVKLNNNTGTAWNAITDWTAGGTPELRPWIGEASNSIDANDLVTWLVDTDGTSNNMGDASNNNAFLSNTAWTFVIFGRTSTNMFLRYNDTIIANAATGLFDGIAIAANMYFGTGDSGTSNFLDGHLAECAKWDRELAATEITALKNGVSPRFYLNGLKWYVPMVRDYNEIKTGIAITNNGSTVSAHPRILYPN